MNSEKNHPITTTPVLKYVSLDSPVVFHQGKAIRLYELLNAVDYLAQKIPEHQYILNLCEERYYFLLVFLLSLKKQSISLFPSTITEHVLNHLKENYTDFLVCSDSNSSDQIPVDVFKTYDIKVLIDEYNESTRYSEVQTEKSPNSSDVNNTVPSNYCSSIELDSIELDKVVAIIFTSGSTGQPKPYTKQWGDLVIAAYHLADQFFSKSTHSEQGLLNSAHSKNLTALLATVPAQHMYGLETSIIMALQKGLLIHSKKPFFPQDITSCLEELTEYAQQSNQALETTLITTPLHLKACVKTGVLLSGVKQFISATAPLEKELAQLCEIHYGVRVMEIFGCTEVGSMAWRRTVESETWTVLKDIVLKTEKNHNEHNEVHIFTSRSIKQFLFNDFIDLLDAQHFLLKGRKEDMINQAGKRTSLSYLNHLLQSYDNLSDACFYQDDSGATNRLIAFVVLKRHSMPEKGEVKPVLSKKEAQQNSLLIRQFLRNKIEAVFLPKKVFFISALPRNATGKLPLSQLKQLLLQLEEKQNV